MLAWQAALCLAFAATSWAAFRDQGSWARDYADEDVVLFGVHKSLYAGSTVSLSVTCSSRNQKEERVDVKVGWVLRRTSCFEEYLGSNVYSRETLQSYYECPMNTNGISKVQFAQSSIVAECSNSIHFLLANVSFDPNAVQPSNPSSPECERANVADVRPVSETDIESKSATVAEKKSSEVLASKEKVELPVTVDSKLENRANAGANAGAKSRRRRDSQPTNASSTKEASQQKRKTEGAASPVPEAKVVSSPISHVGSNGLNPGSNVVVVDSDGVYLFIVKVESLKSEKINVSINAFMKDDYGFLSAVDYPLLLFYGLMCGVYALYAFCWLVVSFLQWRDLLRIQFWIGAVILLGLIEKAVFYGEYQSVNSTGHSVGGAGLFAEMVSCAKRTLARMLVIIVSLGFGIVKPRLGPLLHRVVGVGTLYFVLSVTEGCLRVLKSKNDPSNQALMAGIPLAVTDSAICWWIFSSLDQTIRILRLRRNVVKLSLYRHFTNTLAFAVIASVAYMVWSIHSHKLVTCITDWQKLWIDEAYWHLLFSVVLLAIMCLWRPTNNNQRYAFTPLLDDAADDENDDDFDGSLTNDSFVGMKMRTSKNQPNTSPKEAFSKGKPEDDLKWVEENIPSSLSETALPSLLDSDEEIMTAKFERNKME